MSDGSAQNANTAIIYTNSSYATIAREREKERSAAANTKMAFTRKTLTTPITMLLLIIILLQGQGQAQAQAHRRPRTMQARVWAICKHTTNAMACFKTILPEALAAKHFNVYTALETEVLATQQKVQTTLDRIDAIVADPATGKSTARSLKGCREQFVFAMDSLNKSIALVAKRNAAEAKFEVSAVISFQTSCGMYFDDMFGSGEPNPVEKESQGVYDHAGISLDIMTAIQDREDRRHRGVTNTTTPATPAAAAAASPCQNTVGTCS
ncbi:hypothetical protein Fmac_009454 [Flemingia macrophylla]|uniref:Pectinesterase inhibitor domain-containing protein n=1 Tax=Flemingia macrophylla TaxID=520843 RepID=A0ABD1N0D1_9FABA